MDAAGKHSFWVRHYLYAYPAAVHSGDSDSAETENALKKFIKTDNCQMEGESALRLGLLLFLDRRRGIACLMKSNRVIKRKSAAAVLKEGE